MLSRLLAPFLGRFRSRSAAPGRARAAAPAAPVRPPAPVASAAPPASAAPAAPTPEPASAEALLHASLTECVETLLGEMPKDAARGDLPALLRSLVQDGELTIRQPPSAFQEALSVSRRDDVGLAELVRVIERDPVLSRGALQHASSAFYSRGGGPCRSVSAAAQRVGAAGLHGVVVGCMMKALLLRPGAAHAGMVTKVWEHLVRTGGVARDLAGAFGAQPEQAYTVGLLHDVGKLVLFDRMAAMRTELRRELNVPRPALLRALRLVHEPLGGLATLRWELDGRVSRAIATHHRDPVPDPADTLSELAFVAERIDLHVVRRHFIDVDALCEAGRITVPREWIAASLAGMAYVAA